MVDKSLPRRALPRPRPEPGSARPVSILTTPAGSACAAPKVCHSAGKRRDDDAVEADRNRRNQE